MPYPIITPSFFKELVNTEDPANSPVKYQTLTTPSAIEYVLPLVQEPVVRRLMQQHDIMAFKMITMQPEAEAEYEQKAKQVTDRMPMLKHYWEIKTLTMNILQDRRYTLDQRMLMLNYVYKTIQTLVENPDPKNPDKTDEEKQQWINAAIASFIQTIIHAEDHDDILKYFGDIKPTPSLPVFQGLSFLNSLIPKDGKSEAPDPVKKLVSISLKHAGVEKGGEEKFYFDEALHAAIRKEYEEMFGFDPKRVSKDGSDKEADRSCYMEQIMVNYIWTYCFPFASISNLDLWQNYIFMNSLYNILKITVSCYGYGSKTPDEDFVFAITTLDGALRSVNANIARFLVDTFTKMGLVNNGDMAILTIS